LGHFRKEDSMSLKESMLRYSIVPEDLKHIVLDFKQMEDFIKHPLIMAKADGVWLEDIEGKRYLDGLSGVFTVQVGHNNPRIKEAIKKQMEKICFAPPLHATNIPAIKLAKLMAEIAPGDLNTVKLLSGGSEATEAAMKLGRQYHTQTGSPKKYKVIARYWGYHGATMGGLSATGFPHRKAIFEPTMNGFIHVFPPTCYRCPYGLGYPDCGIRCATIVEDVIKMEGPKTVASMILEPIGNTGGIITPPNEYFTILREICDKYNVLLMFDEIINGFGRTGQMFAAQTFNTIPDVLITGKSMASGYTPMGAITFRDKVEQAFWGGGSDRAFSHGHTFGGNPLSSTATLASIEEIRERDLVTNAREMGGYLRAELEKLKNSDTLGNIIGDIRGKGLMIGVEFIKNHETKESFDIPFGKEVEKILIQKGLILRCDPNWIAFAPPLIVTKEELDQMIRIFVEGVEETLEKVKAGKVSKSFDKF